MSSSRAPRTGPAHESSPAPIGAAAFPDQVRTPDLSATAALIKLGPMVERLENVPDPYAEMPEVAAVMESARALAATMRDVIAETEADTRFTDAGKKDARGQLLEAPVREVGRLMAQVRHAQVADDAALQSIERAATEDFMPRNDFQRMELLELAKVVRESGTTLGDRVAFVNRGSFDLQRAVVAMRPEISGLTPEYIAIIRQKLEGTQIEQDRKAHHLRTGRRDRVLRKLGELREVAVAVSDASRLAKAGAIPKRGRDLSRAERVEHWRKHGSFENLPW